MYTSFSHNHALHFSYMIRFTCRMCLNKQCQLATRKITTSSGIYWVYFITKQGGTANPSQSLFSSVG